VITAIVGALVDIGFTIPGQAWTYGNMGPDLGRRTPEPTRCMTGSALPHINCHRPADVIGYHASHEQVAPDQLLRDVQHAEAVGFEAAMCSDHFNPWSARQGQSGFAWSWLGAALATTTIPFGVVTAPGQRFHPAVAAQAISTLGTMFPGRFWAALGSGEAVNEHITGGGWPAKETRDARLIECVEVIRRLLAGDLVTHHGLVVVDRARLWAPPQPSPQLVAAAVSADTARRAARWADGLITLNQPTETLRQVLDAYRDAGGNGPARLQVHLSYALEEHQAEAIAHDQWRANVFPPPAIWDIDTPEVFGQVSAHVPISAVRRSVQVSADLQRHADWLHQYLELGFNELYLHHVGQDQTQFLDRFGAHVLPQLNG
jgi:probable non-F420 flavinoid oxidoreductase